MAPAFGFPCRSGGAHLEAAEFAGSVLHASPLPDPDIRRVAVFLPDRTASATLAAVTACVLRTLTVPMPRDGDLHHASGLSAASPLRVEHPGRFVWFHDVAGISVNWLGNAGWLTPSRISRMPSPRTNPFIPRSRPKISSRPMSVRGESLRDYAAAPRAVQFTKRPGGTVVIWLRAWRGASVRCPIVSCRMSIGPSAGGVWCGGFTGPTPGNKAPGWSASA